MTMVNSGLKGLRDHINIVYKCEYLGVNQIRGGGGRGGANFFL